MGKPEASKIGQIFFDDDAGVEDWVTFDIVTTETHEAPTDITEYPVEEGADINDNARPGVKRLEIEGFVSRKPLPSTLRATGELDLAKWGVEPMRISEFANRLAGTRSEILDLPQPEPRVLIGPGAVVPALRSLFQSAQPTTATLARYAKSGASLSVQTFQQRQDIDRLQLVQEKLNDIWENSRLCRVITSLEYIDNMIIESRVSRRTREDGSGATFSLSLKRINFVTSGLIQAPNPILKRSLGSRNAKAVTASNETLYRQKLEAVAAVAGPDSSAALQLAGK